MLCGMFMVQSLSTMDFFPGSCFISTLFYSDSVGLHFVVIFAVYDVIKRKVFM